MMIMMIIGSAPFINSFQILLSHLIWTNLVCAIVAQGL